jgi:hypothetical protein
VIHLLERCLRISRNFTYGIARGVIPLFSRSLHAGSRRARDKAPERAQREQRRPYAHQGEAVRGRKSLKPTVRSDFNVPNLSVHSKHRVNQTDCINYPNNQPQRGMDITPSPARGEEGTGGSCRLVCGKSGNQKVTPSFYTQAILQTTTVCHGRNSNDG